MENDYAGKVGLVKHFTQNNLPVFEKLLSVKDRIPELSEKIGVADMGKIIMAEITKFINCYTIVRPMNADQIAQCAFAIISTSEEDKLSLEDLVLFFEGAKQGKYGRVLDHIDQHVIFEMLEQYRESRHFTYLRIKEEQDIKFKSIGGGYRSSDDKKEAEQDIRKVTVEYYKQQQLKNN